ncbi:metal-sensing transcriptional repressor [Stomatobaculum longum]|uniref:metal-sensing transcriptional repressor n=1 Tax=Stomatobaculum longum TaxID=796942 RepID=UPI002F3F4984
MAEKKETACPHCSGMKKVRDGEEQRQLLNRLNRIEGQIRGVKKMLAEDAYCIDILNQVSAANCALNSFTKVLLAAHLKSCVAEDVREGNTEKLEKLDELVRTLQKLMK